MPSLRNIIQARQRRPEPAEFEGEPDVRCEPSAASVLNDVRLELIELQKRVELLMLRVDSVNDRELGLSFPQAERLNAVCRVVGDRFLYSVDSLRSHCRTAPLAWARQVAYILCREQTGLSSTVVGRYFNRDHGTILLAEKAVRARCEVDADARRIVDGLRQQLRASHETKGAHRRPAGLPGRTTDGG